MPYELNEDDEVVKDGGVVTVPVMLMDSAPRERITVTYPNRKREAPAFDARAHQPHAVTLQDADRQRRQSMYEHFDKALGQRYRTAAPTPPTHLDATSERRGAKPAASHLTDREAVYREADRKLEQRWKGGA